MSAWTTCECTAGVCIMHNAELEVQRCDLCKRFETDDDAAAFVEELLKDFEAFARRRDCATVADALDDCTRVLTEGGAPPSSTHPHPVFDQQTLKDMAALLQLKKQLGPEAFRALVESTSGGAP